jgi:hypothetical protein
MVVETELSEETEVNEKCLIYTVCADALATVKTGFSYFQLADIFHLHAANENIWKCSAQKSFQLTRPPATSPIICTLSPISLPYE